MKTINWDCAICRTKAPIKYYLEFKRVYLCGMHKQLWDKQDEKDRNREDGKTKKQRSTIR